MYVWKMYVRIFDHLSPQLKRYFYSKYVMICLHGKLQGTVALYFLRPEGIFLKGSWWIMRAGCHKKNVANNNGRDNYNVEADILSVHQQIPPLQSTNDYNLTISAAQFRLWLMSLNFLIINQLLFSLCWSKVIVFKAFISSRSIEKGTC